MVMSSAMELMPTRESSEMNARPQAGDTGGLLIAFDHHRFHGRNGDHSHHAAAQGSAWIETLHHQD